MSTSLRNSNALNSYIPTLTNNISECITNGDRLTSKIIKKIATPRYQVQLGRYHATEICGCARIYLYVHNRSTLKIEVDEQCR